VVALVEKQIPEQARELGISEAEVIKTICSRTPSTASSRQ